MTWVLVGLLALAAFYILYLLNGISDARYELRRWQAAAAQSQRQIQELRSALRWLGWDPDEDGFNPTIRGIANEAQAIEVQMAQDFKIHRQQVRLEALKRYQAVAYPMRQLVSDVRRSMEDSQQKGGGGARR